MLVRRLVEAWRALNGLPPLGPPARNPTNAAVLNDGRLIVLSQETGTLVFSRDATKVLRSVLVGSKA